MFTKVLYGITIVWFIFSFFKDKDKTKVAFKKGLKSFENILPTVLVVLMIVGLVLTILNKETISQLLGAESGIMGMLIAATIGSLALIPGFVAFPLAASLLKAGAGNAQIAIFISTLMMVGVAMFPLESKYFGKKVAFKRNLLSLIVAIMTSCVIGVVLG